MRGEKDGLVFTQLSDDVADLDDLVRIQSAGGLVQDQDFGFMKECRRESNPLFVSFGKLTELFVALDGKAYERDHGLDPLAFAGQVMDVGDETEVFTDVHVRVERVGFRKVPGPPSCLQGVFPDGDPTYGGFPAVLAKIAGQDLHGGAFAGPVWTQEANDLPFTDSKRDRVNCLLFTVYLNQVLYFN